MAEKNASKKRATQSGPTPTWTIMLYIAADDVLANFAVESLRQLNKSSSALAGSKDKANVVVAAQFAFPTVAMETRSVNANAPVEETKRYYIFKKDKDNSDPKLAVKLIKTTETAETSKTVKTSKLATNTSPKESLKDFLNRVYKNKELDAQNYALILWGHGPELLLQPTPGSSTGRSNRMYITPIELREALKEIKPSTGSLKIIGFDACFMSMFEMAYELQGLAEYMVASQDDVPDASFPYDILIELFREHGEMPLPELLNKGVKAYVDAYQDCILQPDTQMKPVTLSVLNLAPRNSTALGKAVRSLVDALLKAKDEADLADLLIEARCSSPDYAGGLYVDLHGFCTKLRDSCTKIRERYAKPRERVSETEIKSEHLDRIESACRNVEAALKTGTSNLILKRSGARSGHGISIYLPYLTTDQFAEVSKPLVKGGPRTGGDKGFSDMLNGAAAEYLLCARRNLILDTESYYGSLKLAEPTQWYSFIADVWTNALIKTAPADLDFHYSAQQSWMNLCRKLQNAQPR